LKKTKRTVKMVAIAGAVKNGRFLDGNGKNQEKQNKLAGLSSGQTTAFKKSLSGKAVAGQGAGKGAGGGRLAQDGLARFERRLELEIALEEIPEGPSGFLSCFRA